MADAVARIRAFFDEPTNTVSYLVADPTTGRAAVIDPVLDYDPAAGEVDTRSVERILDAAAADGLVIDWILETHAHADHLSGAPMIRERTGARVGIGEHIRDVQRIFRPIFNASDIAPNGDDPVLHDRWDRAERLSRPKALASAISETCRCDTLTCD